MTTSPPTADSAPDEFLAAALAEHGDPLTGEQYMEQVLLARQAAWIEQHKADAAANALTITTVWAPLLPDFVLDADVPHVRLPQSKPKRRPKPRRYRPASYWQDRVDTLDTEMQALSTPIITDRAVAGGAGLGPRRTRRVQKQMDTRLARYTKLQLRHTHAQQMLRAAQARETCQTQG
ncbi:hypothetical protein O4328_28805 [Rhodococcus opacus]|uniref:Uncharacterized protein n=1 Tax=Rhodococcus opacus TaxID=37919 RepID=A0AAX3YQR4_RHOOP|nr:hypothetical protein [Rhodococcus opacus]MCZ4587641.1 hypothetical protein [Rhodococcus opacus]WLF51363.1 hypothetical protein Q5707_37455 [Rhodococcus opacus]